MQTTVFHKVTGVAAFFPLAVAVAGEEREISGESTVTEVVKKSQYDSTIVDVVNSKGDLLRKATWKNVVGKTVTVQGIAWINKAKGRIADYVITNQGRNSACRRG